MVSAPCPSEVRVSTTGGRSLSFVLPAFNEAENIVEAVERCRSTASDLGLQFEIIVVDDGSRDETRRLADAMAAADPRVRTVHHARNRGYGAALKSGLFAARMERVFFTDADLQFDLGDLERLLQYADAYGVVAGYRAPRRDHLGRRFNGWAWSKLVRAMFDLDIQDVDCAFKIFDRRIFELIPVYSIGAFVNTEILVRAGAAGFTVKQVPVSHHPRRAGTQSGANPRVVLKAFHEMWSLHRELRSLPTRAEPDAAWGSGERSEA
jgi:glycosyltransferase involved in cell wall biosynthesis